MIHVMAVARLRGSAVAAAVMGNDAITVIEKEHHLSVPVIGRQRPTMAEHDGLTSAPVLVENLNAVFGRNIHDAPLPDRAIDGVTPAATNHTLLHEGAMID